MCGPSVCFVVFLGLPLHDVGYFPLVGILCPSASSYAATARLAFNKTCCVRQSVSAIEFTLSVQFARAMRQPARSAQGEGSEHMHLQYSRAQLLAVTAARQTSDLVSRLRSLQKGVGLPRKRYRRKRTQCKPGELRVLCYNSQSCRQKASNIHKLMIDNDADVLMLTKTWLYPQDDEAYIAAMTPAGYDFHSFPRSGSRGGGIAFITRTNLSKN